MVLRGGKEVDNKVGEKEHDKEERPKTIESDTKIEKETNLSPSPTIFDPLSHISQWFLTFKLWMHRSFLRKISKEMIS